MHPFARRVADFIWSESLIAPDARVLVALSGGPDSCALLLALCEIADEGAGPHPVGAAHFHHQMRGEDADADAAFAAALCVRLGLPSRIGLGAVAPGGASPEDAARRARYAFLEEAADECGADVVATGHTADDQAETVLLRILRGTGTNGLAGIPARRALRSDLGVARPLLLASRADVEAYCRDRGVAFRRDPSNEAGDYARSRLRSVHLPRLRDDFNARLPDALCRLARAAAGDADLLNGLTDALWARVAASAPGRVRLDAALRHEHPALRQRVLLRALGDLGGEGEDAVSAASALAADALLLAGAGSRDLPGGLRAEAAGSGLTLCRGPARLAGDVRPAVRAAYAFDLPVPGRVWAPPAALTLRCAWTEGGSAPPTSRRSLTVFLAYGTMDSGAAPALTVRSGRPGERIAPLGMGGRTRPVRDVMADAGWPAELRASAPLVARADTGEILWIVGLAQAESTRVGPETPRALRLLAEPDC